MAEFVFAASVAPTFVSVSHDSSQVLYCTSKVSSIDELSRHVRLTLAPLPAGAAVPVSPEGGAGGR